MASLFEAELVLDALRLIRGNDHVVELRLLEATTNSDRWPATWSGYFNDPTKVIDSLRGIKSATGIYITVNPVNPALLGRANNRIRKAGKGASTTDLDILSRRWLLIDTDAVRPSGISASDAEHELAIERAKDIQSHLSKPGWPEPIVADSGNGGHLMYRMDLPADDEGLVQRCLEALAARFDDTQVKIDTKVFNPARIWKLYGTRACKGDSTSDRPHRLANIISAPDQPQVVTLDQLRALGGALPAPSVVAVKPITNGSSFDIETFIAEHNLDVDGPHDWSGQQGAGRRWVFRQSPLCDHHDGAAFILQHGSGAISAQCHHNSCSWGWKELRQRLSNGDKTSSKMQISRASGGFGVLSPSAPEDLHEASELYQPFPVHVFPPPICDYITEASASIGCDPAFVALPMLACLARAIGNNRVIRLKADWLEPAVIWAVIIGKSGSHKTPAIRIATQVLAQKEAESIANYKLALREYEKQVAEYDREYTAWKRSKKSTKTEEFTAWEPPAPHCIRYIVSDITIEALAERLHGQYDGVVVIRDELAGWINGIGEYKGGGKSSDTGHWLSSWSGTSMTVDRKTTTQKTIHIPIAAVSLVGGIQPGILRLALGREHMQDGLCARLLMSMPPTAKVRWRDVSVLAETRLALANVFDRLFTLGPAESNEGHSEPFPIDLSSHAKNLWIEYYDRHREEMEVLDDDLTAASTKLEAYTARFSLIFQLCSWAAGTARDAEIDEMSVRGAIELSDWFGNEAKRVYSQLAETDDQAEERQLIERIQSCGGSISVRDLNRKFRRLYPTSDGANAALGKLEKAGLGNWKDVPPTEKGGRPTRVFCLNCPGDKTKTP